MSEPISFLTHLKTLTTKKRVKRVRQFINPLREWVVCLSISLIAAVGLIGHAAFDFHTQLNDHSVPTITEEQIPRYRPEDAELILRYYEGREKTFEAFQMSGLTPAPVEVPEGDGLPTAI